MRALVRSRPAAAFGARALAAGAAPAYKQPMPAAGFPLPLPVFRALAEAFVPEAAALDARAWEEAEGIVGGFLASRPASVRRQAALLVRLLDLLPLVFHGRRFRSLDVARRTRLLERLQDAPVLLVRRGIWGLRTLAFMGFYGRAEAAGAIGYRADPRGWEARP